MDETELAELKAMAISQHIPAGEMTRAHFIALHMDRFARRGKRRNICGVISIDNVNLGGFRKRVTNATESLRDRPRRYLVIYIVQRFSVVLAWRCLALYLFPPPFSVGQVHTLFRCTLSESIQI